MRDSSRRGARLRRWTSALAAGVLAALSVTGAQAASGQSPPGDAGGPADSEQRRAPDVLPAGGRWTVTLVTGEVVDVAADGEGRVTAQVREHDGPYRSLRLPDGELYVIPVSVTGLLGGVLDLELFNVTGLVRQGYHDEARADVPLIVERAPGTDVAARVASAEERPLPSIGAVAVAVPKSDTAAAEDLIAELDAGAEARRRAGVSRIWLDGRVSVQRAAAPAAPFAPAAPDGGAVLAQAPPLDGNLTQIGADDAWAAGLTGEGTTVAVLDTGADATHPDLAGRIDAQENFSDSEDAVDRDGHGTHVASLVAGTGAAAGGARRGVAPDARLIVGKVLGDDGFGTESQVIAGMEWAAPRADVVNMSLGAETDTDSDPLTTALDNLSEQHGTLFVVAAGNAGPASRTIDSPGVADRALTVGAVDGQDALADFSGRSPVAGSYELKPEVVAPGVDIVAARASGTAMGDPVGESYVTASGTSMAAPQVAGAAALLAQRQPEWDADELKNTLIGSATALDADGYDVGSGRIDVGAGVAATVRPGRDAVEVTLPDPREDAHTETLTWANDGDEPVTVALAAALEDREGEAVDEVAIEPAELTIAPGATAAATLAIDGPDIDDGLYSGVVTATTGAGATARTPVAVHTTVETAELTIASTPPTGGAGAAPETFAWVANLDDFGLFHLATGFAGESLTVEVPVGRYAVTGDVYSGDRDEEVFAQVGDADVTIDGDTTVELDGAAAVPLRPTVEGVDTAPPMYTSAALQVTPSAGSGGYTFATELYTFHPMPAVRVTPMEGDAEHFAATQTFRLQAPHLTARTGGEALALTDVDRARPPAPGQHAYQAVDAGDGADLSGARDRLAVVTLPADPAERVAVTRRALDAGVALLAFVDEGRDALTLDGWAFDPELRWADVPVVAAAGGAATRLRSAAAGGAEVSVTVAGSPYVYDVVTPATDRVDPEPVIDRDEQRRMAAVSERFHRDPDGTGATGDRRYSRLNLMNLDSAGPLPERRTSYLSPGVPWQSMTMAPSLVPDPLTGEPTSRQTAVSMESGRVYEPGSRHHARWLRRPQWPGPVGAIPSEPNGGCHPTPVTHGTETLYVWLSAFQERLDGRGCGDPLTGSLTLERDGVPVPEREEEDPIIEFGEFPVPAGPAGYRLTYEQEGQAPYAHRSTTTWTFRSAAPAEGEPALVPLLVVGYDLPLDTRNRPTAEVATLTVRQMTGAAESRVERVRAWTSTDDGATWRPATVRHEEGAQYRLRLPRAAAGTGVSVRVSAADAAGATIDQTLYDAYAA